MEILIRVVSKPFTTRKEEVERMHRGDVVAAKPDGWEWSDRELTSPDWRIFKLPNMTETMANALLASEGDPDGVKTLTWKRKRKLDLDHASIPQPIVNYLSDDTRKKAFYSSNASEETLLYALEVIKPDADT